MSFVSVVVFVYICICISVLGFEHVTCELKGHHRVRSFVWGRGYAPAWVGLGWGRGVKIYRVLNLPDSFVNLNVGKGKQNSLCLNNDNFQILQKKKRKGASLSGQENQHQYE